MSPARQVETAVNLVNRCQCTAKISSMSILTPSKESRRHQTRPPEIFATSVSIRHHHDPHFPRLHSRRRRRCLSNSSSSSIRTDSVYIHSFRDLLVSSPMIATRSVNPARVHRQTLRLTDLTYSLRFQSMYTPMIQQYKYLFHHIRSEFSLILQMFRSFIN